MRFATNKTWYFETADLFVAKPKGGGFIYITVVRGSEIDSYVSRHLKILTRMPANINFYLLEVY